MKRWIWSCSRSSTGQPGRPVHQKADASTIGDLAKAVQKLFGDTGTHIIGTRHGEKLYETLMTREERLRSEDMGNYYRVAADNRDLNYDKYVVKGQVHTMADESYTSHNTNRLDVEGTVKKILTTDYVKEALANWEAGESMNILVTGSKGMVGTALVNNLKNIRDGKNARDRISTSTTSIATTSDNTPEQLTPGALTATLCSTSLCGTALRNNEEFMQGNFGFASTLLDTLKKHGNKSSIMLSSSIQATLIGRYGQSDYGKEQAGRAKSCSSNMVRRTT